LTRHIALLAVAICCAYTDLAWGKLYNVVTFGGLALGLALAYLLDVNSPGFPHLRQAVLGAALGGALFFVLYLLGGFDAGDAKMMAAVGALGGSVGFVIQALVYTALVGAAIAVGILIWQGRLRQGLKGSARTMFSFRRVRREEVPPSAMMPYGLAIGIGTVWAWLELTL
jgi:Flp pilus assembly protein protease CpaA